MRWRRKTCLAFTLQFYLFWPISLLYSHIYISRHMLKAVTRAWLRPCVLPFPFPFSLSFSHSFLFVPMFLLGSIHQNVFACPKSVLLNQMGQFLWKAVSAFSNRSAVFKHLSKKGFNFPGSQYLLLPLSLETVWVRRGLCSENILIRCPPSFWKCLSPFVVLWIWWKFLSDMLVILLIHISHPIYISVMWLLPDWHHHVINTQKHITNF